MKQWSLLRKQSKIPWMQNVFFTSCKMWFIQHLSWRDLTCFYEFLCKAKVPLVAIYSNETVCCRVTDYNEGIRSRDVCLSNSLPFPCFSSTLASALEQWCLWVAKSILFVQAHFCVFPEYSQMVFWTRIQLNWVEYCIWQINLKNMTKLHL